jgi:hemerythrin
MSIVNWNESYLLGIDDIDSHHEHLVALLNDTYDTIVARESAGKIEKIFDDLIAYSKYHFAAEESMMNTLAYPKLDEHVLLHDAFSREIDRFQSEFHNGNTLITVGVLTYLKDWLINHILTNDVDFGKFKSTMASTSCTK